MLRDNNLHANRRRNYLVKLLREQTKHHNLGQKSLVFNHFQVSSWDFFSSVHFPRFLVTTHIALWRSRQVQPELDTSLLYIICVLEIFLSPSSCKVNTQLVSLHWFRHPNQHQKEEKDEFAQCSGNWWQEQYSNRFIVVKCQSTGA